jgi:heme oxygenase (mycobilin-producing)
VIAVILLDAEDAIAADAERALRALAARPGYLRGSAGPSVDDPDSWVLATEWRGIGDYRRALGSFDVKMHATALLARARDVPSTFEQLISVDPEGTVWHASTDRAEDGD